ncbi:unnamed protein product [Parascedosporium putredinis]|uniref:Uncharacterized protein n=1 Tax=Parascedosporium putredinis TaxID=1442378 RepID=A0A9P1H216_9PEZI|nr:unnamed protein product [Parascedosporium putredinis]CAI7995681.1 unnamed protein product [Parascedosporium putredinis]
MRADSHTDEKLFLEPARDGKALAEPAGRFRSSPVSQSKQDSIYQDVIWAKLLSADISFLVIDGIFKHQSDALIRKIPDEMPILESMILAL